MELVHIVAGGFTCVAVGGHTPPDLILHHQHPDLFQLLAQLLDVIADQPVIDIYVGAVVKQVQRTGHIDFQCRCHMVCFLFILPEQCLVQVLQHRHVLRHRILKIGLVNLMNATVDDRLFYRLQAFLAAHDQLAQRQDEICFQGNRIILF